MDIHQHWTKLNVLQFWWNTCWNFYDEDAQQTNKQANNNYYQSNENKVQERKRKIFKENWNLYTVTINKWIIYRHNNNVIGKISELNMHISGYRDIRFIYFFSGFLFILVFFDDFFSLSPSLSLSLHVIFTFLSHSIRDGNKYKIQWYNFSPC